MKYLKLYEDIKVDYDDWDDDEDLDNDEYRLIQITGTYRYIYIQNLKTRKLFDNYPFTEKTNGLSLETLEKVLNNELKIIVFHYVNGGPMGNDTNVDTYTYDKLIETYPQLKGIK